MPTFATPGPIAATVEVGGARVRVTAGDRTDTAVLVEPVDEASRFDVKVADKTKVDFAGGRLSVKTTVAGEKGSDCVTCLITARVFSLIGPRPGVLLKIGYPTSSIN